MINRAYRELAEEELIEALERWNRDSYEPHLIQKVGRTPRELFETEEAGTLRGRCRSGVGLFAGDGALLHGLSPPGVVQVSDKHPTKAACPPTR